MQRLQDACAYNSDSIEKILLPAQRLDSILANHTIDHIDYLSLDTEGNELEILQSIDFSKIHIHVISVENNYHDPAIKLLLESKGFHYVTRLVIDDIYVHF